MPQPGCVSSREVAASVLAHLSSRWGVVDSRPEIGLLRLATRGGVVQVHLNPNLFDQWFESLDFDSVEDSELPPAHLICIWIEEIFQSTSFGNSNCVLLQARGGGFIELTHAFKGGPAG